MPFYIPDSMKIMKRLFFYGACIGLFWSCGSDTVHSSYEVVEHFPVDPKRR